MGMEQANSDSLIKGTTPDIICSRFSSDAWRRESTSVPREMGLTIYVNGGELVTILCTPTKLIQLVLGFLYSEGIIADKDDVAVMRVCEEESLADIRLRTAGYMPPARRTLGSGCGGGIRSYIGSVEAYIRRPWPTPRSSWWSLRISDGIILWIKSWANAY
jgi:FdhD protein